MIAKTVVRNLPKATFTFLFLCRFLISFSLFFCLVGAALGTDESPDVIEKVRSFLKERKANCSRGKKSSVSDELDVSSTTLNSGLDVTKPFPIKLLKSFKVKFPDKYAEFISSSVAIKTESQDSIHLLKTESDVSYPCLDITTLLFQISFPDSYSLLMVNSALIPLASVEDWNQYADFREIGIRFLRPSIARDQNVSFAVTEQEAQIKQQWVLKNERTMRTSNEKEELYYIVQLFKKRETTRTANLVKLITGGYITAYGGFDFQAALVIFPCDPYKAMIYGLGCWNSLLNPDCIIPQWGLRLLTSGLVCNPDKIKIVDANHYRDSNPFARREKAAALQPIEVFGLEVGSEELKTITLMPNKSVKTRHVLEGKDHLQFTINPSEEATLTQTLQSLKSIATYFSILTTSSNFRVHSRMREFIDNEITEEKLIHDLNQRLQELFRMPDNKSILFLHDDFWKEMKCKRVSFGEDKKSSAFDVFSQVVAQTPLPPTLKVWTPRLKTPREFDVFKIFYSLPFEYQENFYRFDRAHWYQVDSSRFESIKRIMRERKQHSNTLCLPEYSLEDTQRSTDIKKADYKEAKYNLKAVRAINQQKGWEAILLDRINISLGEPGHKFEFADLLVVNDGTLYLVHIKRAEASAFSHHREQVERSADYLATELVKKNAHEVLLQGLINGLYEDNGLPVKKDKGQGKRITKGNSFLDFYNSIKARNNLVSALQTVQTSDQNLMFFINQVSQILHKNLTGFFENHSVELSSALDALLDCTHHKGAHFDNIEINKFLSAVRQAILVRNFLFPTGILKKTDLEKIKIVLAVINDQGIECILHEKAPRSQHSIFKNQDLWGLDRTQTMVEKAGLGFGLMVINENATETCDAFGPIIKKERKKITSMSGDEPENTFVFPVKMEAPLLAGQTQTRSTRKSLRMFLGEINDPIDFLDTTRIQKVQYIMNPGQSVEYLTCPTVGDGDCFFHAAFTDEGDTIQTVKNKAAEMRKGLCNVVQANQYLDDLQHLVYEHYLELLSDETCQEVPEIIKQEIKKKNEYESMYNSMQRFGLPMIGVIRPEEKFPVDQLKALIKPENIKDYMERFRAVGNYETYIPTRPGVVCPACILAILGQKRINIFTFNSNSRRLDFIKTAGTTGPIVDIIHAGKHFVRLYDALKEDSYMNQCQHIIANWELLHY